MIIVEYPGKHKVNRLAQTLGLDELFDPQAIAYLPAETYFVSSTLPFVASGTNYSLKVNGHEFTDYVIELDGNNRYVAMFPVSGTGVWKLGGNTINFYIDGNLFDTKEVETKNIYALLSWNVGLIDNALTDIRPPLEWISLQTMPAKISSMKFSSLLPKYSYLPESSYGPIVRQLFTGSVNAGTVMGLTQALNGFVVPEEKNILMIRASGTTFYDLLADPNEVIYRRIEFFKGVNVFQKLNESIIRSHSSSSDYITHHGLSVKYSSINFDQPITVSFGSEIYIYDTDYVINKDVYGFAYISWKSNGNAPPNGSSYNITFTYEYTMGEEYEIRENTNGVAYIDWSKNVFSPIAGSAYGIRLHYRGYDILVNSLLSTYRWWLLQNRRLHETMDKTGNGYSYTLVSSGSYPVFAEQNKTHYLIKPNETRTDTLLRDNSLTYDYLTQDHKIIKMEWLKEVKKVTYSGTVYTEPLDYVVTSVGGYAVIDWAGGVSSPPANGAYSVEYSLAYSTDRRRKWLQLLKSRTRSDGIIVKWFNYVFKWTESFKVHSVPYVSELVLGPIVDGYTINNITYPIVYYLGSVGTRVYISNYSIGHDGKTITIHDSSTIGRTVYVEYYFAPLALIKYVEDRAAQVVSNIINMFYDSNGNLFKLLGV